MINLPFRIERTNQPQINYIMDANDREIATCYLDPTGLKAEYVLEACNKHPEDGKLIFNLTNALKALLATSPNDFYGIGYQEARQRAWQLIGEVEGN